MLTLIENLPAETVGVRIAGTVRADECLRVLEPAVTAAAHAATASGHPVNVLAVIEPGVSLFGLAALGRDAELRKRLTVTRTWGRIAVVCDQKTLGAMIGVAAARTKREVRQFSGDHEAEAIAWLGGADA